jgi:GH43 family beta-xylosidase
MQNPYTICGERVLIAQPEHQWERVEMPICEGPQILKHNGKVFLVYSASASWTVDYCLGLLMNVDNNFLNPASWKKISAPVFAKNENIWGVGHCSFVKSPCQTEDWIVYHAKTDRNPGWLDRRVHAQRFNWTEDGLPQFGTPLPDQSRWLSV